MSVIIYFMLINIIIIIIIITAIIIIILITIVKFKLLFISVSRNFVFYLLI